MKPKLVVAIVAGLLSGLCASSFAQPEVNDVSAPLLHKGVVTLNGSGFGVKVPAAPLMWDDFDSGVENDRVADWYTWSNLSGYYPKYSSERVRTAGSKAAHQFFGDGNYNCTLGLVRLPDTPIYISGWFYNTTYGAPTRNTKLISYRGGNPGEWKVPNGRTDLYPINGSGHMYIADCDGTDIGQDWGLRGDLYSDAWHRLESYMDMGTVGVADGVYEVFRDGQEWASFSGVMRNSDCRYNNVYLMSYFALDRGDPKPSMDFYWDELYVDITKARIELGNASTWAASTHKEIQIPRTWTANEISFQVNQGTFADGQQVYLYVVDENGVANSNGLPVTVSGGGTPPPEVNILFPTSSSSYASDVGTVELAGNADGPSAITGITWSRLGGGGGTATNVSGDWTSWSVADLALDPGTNTITVTVTDAADMTGIDTIVIEYASDEGPPGQPGRPVAGS